ncbi:MAG TPA: amidophosphoribosyltransferase, partial [Clostridiales bacterium]|nr:amidophosphoribosyltransferase [Clostridiales bacterium]
MFDKLKEECGVFGMFSKENIDIAPYTYYALFALQHRGQESCGIVVNDDGIMALHKNVGLVNEVFTPEIMATLGKGNISIGHVRYGTT